MNNINFSIDDGKIQLNGEIIAPLSLSDFKAAAEKRGVIYNEFHPTAGWTTVGLDVNIISYQFGMNISYSDNTLAGCWFGWDGGISGLKGYNATEKELIADKNSLTKIIASALCRQPDKQNYNNDVFLYEWGCISTSASLKSSNVAVGVKWMI